MSDGSKVALGAVVGALLVLLLFGGFSGGMGHMMGGGVMGPHFAGLFWIVPLALLVAVVVWFIGGTRRG